MAVDPPQSEFLTTTLSSSTVSSIRPWPFLKSCQRWLHLKRISRLSKDLRVSSYQIPALDLIPNTSIQRKPLLIYHSAFHSSVSASIIESHLSTIGVVGYFFQAISSYLVLHLSCETCFRSQRLPGPVSWLRSDSEREILTLK